MSNHEQFNQAGPSVPRKSAAGDARFPGTATQCGHRHIATSPAILHGTWTFPKLKKRGALRGTARDTRMDGLIPVPSPSKSVLLWGMEMCNLAWSGARLNTVHVRHVLSLLSLFPHNPCNSERSFTEAQM